MDLVSSSWIAPLQGVPEAARKASSRRELTPVPLEKKEEEEDESYNNGYGQARSLCIDSDRSASSEESRRPRLLAPAALAGILLLGVLGIGAIFWRKAPSFRESQLEEEEPAPRLLGGLELVDTVVKHTVAFHTQFGVSADDFGTTQPELEEQIAQAARVHVRRLLHEVEVQDAGEAQALRELRITREQWNHVHALLDAAHDERVRVLGMDVMQDDPSTLKKHMSSRQAQLRQLSHELIPESVQSSAAPWHVFIGQHGEMGAKAQLGQWNASLEVDAAEFPGLEVGAPPEEAPVASRRLAAMSIFTIVASSLAGVLSIVFTIMTAIYRSLHPLVGRFLWIIDALFAGVTCGANLGQTLHVNMGEPALMTWIPCMIMASFSGLEAIWTFWK